MDSSGSEGNTLQQEIMIERVRELCQEDERLVAAMMYGSFVQGEGDEFSDIEFFLFFEDELLEGVDPEEWVSRIEPVALYFVNDFGIGTAIFEDLIRGEFHFERASDIEQVDESWRETDFFPSLETALVVDRTGELTRRLREISGPPPKRDTPERVRRLSCHFLNTLLFGMNVLDRGELARGLNMLNNSHLHLLRLARISESATLHWATPSKFLEKDLSEDLYARYAPCIARLDEEELRRAYRHSWEWGRELMEELGVRHGVKLPPTLLDSVGERVGALR